MELGVSRPTAGPLASPEVIVRVAQVAERLGYAAVWTFERLLRPIADTQDGGSGPPIPENYRTVYDPLETLSYVAALTERIKLGTSVIDGLFHPPVMLARRYATLDRFSGGRVIAGLGQGWMPQEFETANVPIRRRGDGLDEVIAAMRACWGPDPVEYSGRYYRIAPSEVNPKPVRGHIPILIGAMTPAGARRAGRVADGINPIAYGIEQLTGLMTEFFAAAEKAGRDRADLSVVVRANVPITREPLGDDRPYLGGAPEQIAADLAGLAELGSVDHVLFNDTDSNDTDELVTLLEHLQSTVAGRV
jgi:probable F420-dependent oxidoreductase